MELLSKLSPKMKVLIVFIYTAIIVSLGLIIFNIVQAKEKDNFSEYQEEAFDENISFIVRVKENRTKADLSNEFNKERATWDVVVYFTKENVEAQIKKVHTFLTVLAADGTLLYNEKMNTVDLVSSTIPSATINTIAKKTNEYNSTTKEFLKTNQEPKFIYIKVNYECKNENNVFELKTINYKVELLNEKNYQFNNFEERLTNQETGGKKNYFLNQGELYDLLIEARLNNASKDRFRITVVEANKEDKIKNIKLAFYANAENDPSDSEEYFSNLIKVEQYFGVINAKAKVNLLTSPEYSTSYKIDKLFIVGISSDSNGKTTTKTYWTDVNKLKKY